VWIPIGVKIGLNPKLTQRAQPIIQFLAAFPVNLVYPVVVLTVLKFNLNVEIWTMPLIILGTQWYILFNVIAGASSIPKDLQLVAQNFGVKNWLLWKRLMLPAIFPFYVTGAITAAGGAWNASIVAEVLQWGNQKLVATGLGSYIAEHTSTGDFPRIVLGIGVMCTYVIVINRLIWNKLYQFATTRFALE
jgi:NitT/TauT family transport system permease protein